MKLEIEIQEKTKGNITREVKGSSSENVYMLDEIQAIKNAANEHLLVIGMDNGLNVKDIRLIGVGKNNLIQINIKDIVRDALINMWDNVIVVHNHPSNSLKASKEDIEITNKITNALKVFNINLLDHIIVTENEYHSMEKFKEIDRKSLDKDILNAENIFLEDENKQLKNKIKELKKKISKKEKVR